MLCAQMSGTKFQILKGLRVGVLKFWDKSEVTGIYSFTSTYSLHLKP